MRDDDRAADALSAELASVSSRYPFGPISILGPLDELLLLHSASCTGPAVRFRPPDAVRLQYLTCGTTSTPTPAPARTGGEAKRTARAAPWGEACGLARCMAAQDGYGVAARQPVESQTEVMLCMVSLSYCNIPPARRS